MDVAEHLLQRSAAMDQKPGVGEQGPGTDG